MQMLMAVMQIHKKEKTNEVARVKFIIYNLNSIKRFVYFVLKTIKISFKLISNKFYIHFDCFFFCLAFEDLNNDLIFIYYYFF